MLDFGRANMRTCTIALACIGLSSPALSADLGTFLGKDNAALRTELAGVASCTDGPHTIRLPIVDAHTEVRPDLFNPVPGHFVAADGSGEFTYSLIGVTTCEMPGSALVRSYSRAGQIFRISVTYTRCKNDAAAGSCLGTDERPRPYDAEIYSAMSHKDAYISSADGSFFSAYPDTISDPMVKKYVYDLDCGPWVSEFTFNQKRSAKCIADISMKDGVFASTTVYEIYDDGYISNTLVGRFAGERIFVDVAAEQDVIADLAAKMSTIVEQKQAEIAKLKTEEQTKEDRVNEILGSTPAK